MSFLQARWASAGLPWDGSRAIPDGYARTESLSEPVSRKSQLLLVLILGLLVLGGVFVLTWEIPPPSTQVEKVIPDDRFPR